MSGSGKSILYVEDNRSTALQFVSLMTDIGWDITYANCGRDALDILEFSKATYDAFVFDFYLPDMTGVELLNAVRQRVKWALMPVIICTAAGQEAIGLIAQAMPRLGPLRVLQKPFTTDVLFALLSEMGVQVEAAK